MCVLKIVHMNNHCRMSRIRIRICKVTIRIRGSRFIKSNYGPEHCLLVHLPQPNNCLPYQPTIYSCTSIATSRGRIPTSANHLWYSCTSIPTSVGRTPTSVDQLSLYGGDLPASQPVILVWEDLPCHANNYHCISRAPSQLTSHPCISVVDLKLFFFFGSGFNLNFGFGSGLFMKEKIELQII